MNTLEKLVKATIPVRDAAKIIGCTERQVHNYINAGKLETAKIGHAVLMSKEQVEKFAEARRLTKMSKPQTSAVA